MSNGVCEIVRQACGHRQALLSFSCGKDSWAAWLSARDSFDFQPYYLYLVPGLEFVDEYLGYAERVLGKRVVRLPHPSFYRMVNKAIFQAPERLRIIHAANLGEPDYDDMRDAVIEDCALPDNCWVASGVRAADSPMRRAALIKNGGINANRRQFYPCWDWNKATLIEQLQAAGIKLPVDYKIFGRSFDGIDLRFLIKLRDVFPRDYKTVLDWFPLADMEIARYEFNRRKKSQAVAA